MSVLIASGIRISTCREIDDVAARSHWSEKHAQELCDWSQTRDAGDAKGDVCPTLAISILDCQRNTLID